MADGWLEERTRIPLAGIIAMVIIVAVVAFFMRAQLQALFPDSTVLVQDAAAQEALNVRGSASFAGEREVQLIYKQRYVGLLTTGAGSLRFAVDVPAHTLTIVAGGLREEIVLAPTDDGEGLAATFEYAGKQTSVRVDPVSNELTFADGGLPITVALSDIVVYEGVFTHAGKQYLFQLEPGASAFIFGDGVTSEVGLVRIEGGYLGTWSERKTKHPVFVDSQTLIVRIGELW